MMSDAAMRGPRSKRYKIPRVDGVAEKEVPVTGPAMEGASCR